MEASDTVQRFLTFRIAEQLYALRANQVSEVIRVPLLARVPLGPPALLGLANLRGTVLPIASLRALLKRSPDGDTNRVADAESERAIVMDIGAPIALVVDSVDSLETAPQERIETGKSDISAADGETLLGAFATNRGNAVAKILDIKPMLETAFANRARVRQPAYLRAQRETTEAEAETKTTETIVSFEVAGQEFALPLENVLEILPVPASVTAIARADSVVLGVVSIRDSLLPLLSLRALLGFSTQGASHLTSEQTERREKIIVMNVAGTQIGLVADRARAVVAAEAESIDPIPPVLAVRTGGESRIRSIYRGDSGRRLISILAPEQLLKEDIMQRLAAGRTGISSVAEMTSESAEQLIYLVFRLGEEEFGLPIDTVVEVAQVPPQITRVPKTPKFLEGVVNLRGDVLPVIDQRRRFAMPPFEQLESRKLVVIKTERHKAGIIVDSVTDVLRTSREAIEPPPDLTDAMSRLVRGIINLEAANRMVLILDSAEVLTRAEECVLDKFSATGDMANATRANG